MLQATFKGGVIRDYLRCFKDTWGTARLLKVIWCKWSKAACCVCRECRGSCKMYLQVKKRWDVSDEGWKVWSDWKVTIVNCSISHRRITQPGCCVSFQRLRWSRDVQYIVDSLQFKFWLHFRWENEHFHLQPRKNLWCLNTFKDPAWPPRGLVHFRCVGQICSTFAPVCHCKRQIICFTFTERWSQMAQQPFQSISSCSRARF